MKRIFIFIILGLVLFLGANNVLAAVASNCTNYCNSLIPPATPLDPPSGQVCICNPLTSPDFERIVDKLIDFIFKIAIVLAPLMIVVGAFYIMTAAGEAQKVTTGKNIIIYTLIGFAIVLLAKGILTLINELLGVK